MKASGITLKRIATAILVATGAHCQIVSTASTATAAAGTVTCVISAIGTPPSDAAMICTRKAAQYATWTPKLNNGAGGAITITADGNMINPGLSMTNNIVTWSLTVSANGSKVVTRASGTFTAPAVPPPPPGVPLAWTLVGGACVTQGTGFTVVGPYPANAISNEVYGNCLPKP